MVSALAYGSLLTLGAGVAIGALGRRLVELGRAQRACDARYQRMQRGAQDALWELHVGTACARYAPRLYEMLEATPQGAPARREFWLDRVHPDERPALDAGLLSLSEGRTERFECEHRLKTDAGSWLWVHVRAVRVETRDGPLLTGWISDISERKSAEGQLRFHAFRDSLTGLANRSLFMDRLAQCVAQGVETSRAAVLLIDLDRFKRVNDSLSHSAGDALLFAVAERLSACVSPGDTVARLGGDEFALLLHEVASSDEAIDVARRARKALHEPVMVEGRPVTVDASIGIVRVSDSHATPGDVLRDADTAMYRAKALGRGRWALFDTSMRARAMERMVLENELREALTKGEIETFFQPMVDARGRFTGGEALPRWRHPRLGLLPAAEFIELAEETGLIVELGDLVVQQACSMGRRIVDMLDADDWTLHINLSPKQLRRPDLSMRVQGVLESTGLAASRLCFEVTEDLILGELPDGSALFSDLRARGVKLCMDDFGTGYSSLTYLHRFRFDFLKIDAAFVRAAEARESGEQIVRSMVNLARNLGIMPVAEGVENERQWQLLKELGCPRAQGFWFAEPLAQDAFVAWVRKHGAARA